MLTIAANHPVRNAVASLDTYHDSKGDLLRVVCDAYEAHGIDVKTGGLDGDAGCALFELRPMQTAHVVCESCAAQHDKKAFVNCAVVYWHTMPSGRIELTSYVS